MKRVRHEVWLANIFGGWVQLQTMQGFAHLAPIWNLKMQLRRFPTLRRWLRNL